MSINFSTLQGLTIPEGVVTQITDAAGSVLWKVASNGGQIVLEVKKITSNTYANSTTYSNEKFILLSITPKSASSVIKVTYGGLTKTLTFSFAFATNVFFGTFNGVSDETETPDSGTLTIEGDCIAFGVGSFNTTKSTTTYCGCITSVTNSGNIAQIPHHAFSCCTALTSVDIPVGVTYIGLYAFEGCTNLTSATIPSSVTSIEVGVFDECAKLTSITVDSGNEYYSAADGVLFNKDKTELHSYPSVSGSYTIPSSVTSIGDYAFNGCENLTGIAIPHGVTSIGTGAFQNCVFLGNITIPSSVNSIGSGAFNLPYNARVVTMLSTTPAKLGGDSVFDVVGTNKIVVPAGCGDIYKAAEYWSEYADYITEASA